MGIFKSPSGLKNNYVKMPFSSKIGLYPVFNLTYFLLHLKYIFNNIYTGWQLEIYL